MSTSSDTAREPDVSPTKCFVCGKHFAATDLKRASMPPVLSLAAATDIEPGDTEPPPVFVDPNWYCSSCRSRVNRRRKILAIVFVIWTIALAWIAAMLRGWF
jgi:hypothetical protein